MREPIQLVLAQSHIGLEVSLGGTIDITRNSARVVEMRSLDRVQNFLDQRALEGSARHREAIARQRGPLERMGAFLINLAGDPSAVRCIGSGGGGLRAGL